MKDAMDAIEGYTLQLDAEDIAAETEARYSKNMSMGDTVDTETTIFNKSMAEVRKIDFIDRAAAAKGAEKLILKGAANSVSMLEKIGGDEGTPTITDLRAVKFAVAALVFAEMLKGPEGDAIRSKMPDGVDAYKAQIKKMVDSKEFDSVMPEISSREEIMALAGDEVKTRELCNSLKEKTAEMASKEKTGPEKAGKSVGPEQKKDQEITQRKRSNTVAGRSVQPRI
jgi:hypothetical protein